MVCAQTIILILPENYKKEPGNMRMTVVLIVAGTLGTIPKGLERGVEELETRKRIDILLTTALLR